MVANRKCKAESARDRILRVAARLYALHGYQGTSIRQIAEGAHVTKPLIYYHFGSKEQLYESLLRGALDVALREARGVLKRERGAIARYRAFIECQVDLARRAPEIYGFVHEVMTAPGVLPLGFDYRREGRRLLDLYSNVIRGGQRDGDLRIFPAHVAVLMPMAAIGTCVAGVLAGRMKRVPAGLGGVLFELMAYGVARGREVLGA